MTTPKTVAFNTGRLYTSAGQRIAALIADNGGLLFVDIDRGIEGFVAHDKLGEDFELTRECVMLVYDYQSKDWNCGEPFRHPEAMQHLRKLAGVVPPMKP